MLEVGLPSIAVSDQASALLPPPVDIVAIINNTFTLLRHRYDQLSKAGRGAAADEDW